MKKLLFIIAVLGISHLSSAQTIDSSKHTYERCKEQLWMNGNKMVYSKDCKTIVIKNDMYLPNGISISPSGIVKKQNAKSLQLKNGDMINMDGTITESTSIKPKYKL